MKLKQLILKIKVKDKFNLIDSFFSKIFIISLSSFVIFSTVNFMSKGSFYQSNLLLINAKEIKNNFKIGVFSDTNIKLYSFDVAPNIDENKIYNEVIYFDKNKDLGSLLYKSIDLIETSSSSVQEEYIQVSIRNYNTGNLFFKIIWSRESPNDYKVFLN